MSFPFPGVTVKVGCSKVLIPGQKALGLSSIICLHYASTNKPPFLAAWPFGIMAYANNVIQNQTARSGRIRRVPKKIGGDNQRLWAAP